jgi:hypothetical protein
MPDVSVIFMGYRSCLVFALLSLLGCGATEAQLRARAAYDMQCDQSQLQITQIDDRTMGVSGCGQRTVYVESCAGRDGYGGKHDCTWILNADAKRANQ